MTSYIKWNDAFVYGLGIFVGAFIVGDDPYSSVLYGLFGVVVAVLIDCVIYMCFSKGINAARALGKDSFAMTINTFKWFLSEQVRISHSPFNRNEFEIVLDCDMNGTRSVEVPEVHAHVIAAILDKKYIGKVVKDA